MHRQPVVPYARLNAFHGPKRQLLGNTQGPPPSWRVTPLHGPLDKGKATLHDSGSKILLSRLPVDVGEPEVEELFRKTVGPLKDSFIVYNSQGKSKGMAVITFQRSGDAAVARSKYDGKIVDGRRPIKIEIIADGLSEGLAQRAPPTGPSLLARLGGVAKARPATGSPMTQKVPVVKQPPRATKFAPVAAAVIPPRRLRTKKGPKRLKKAATTVGELDMEIEAYRQAAPEYQ